MHQTQHADDPVLAQAIPDDVRQRRRLLSREFRDRKPSVREVQGLIARPDGNNVSIDREGLLLSEVQMEFSAASQLVKDEFRGLELAIREGS